MTSSHKKQSKKGFSYKSIRVKQPTLLLFVVSAILTIASTTREKLIQLSLAIFDTANSIAMMASCLLITASIMLTIAFVVGVIVMGTEPVTN